MQFLVSCGRHSFFIFMWPLHLSFAARFSNMPCFRQSLSRNAITKFHQMWYIYIYIYSKTLSIDACNFSSWLMKCKYQFYYIWKKIPLLLNRCVHNRKLTAKGSQCNYFIGSLIARFMGPTRGPRWAPCWPHEPCYQNVLTHLIWFITLCGDIITTLLSHLAKRSFSVTLQKQM